MHRAAICDEADVNGKTGCFGLKNTCPKYHKRKTARIFHFDEYIKKKMLFKVYRLLSTFE